MVLGQLSPMEIAPNPDSNPNPKQYPNPNWGAIFLVGNCPNTTKNEFSLKDFLNLNLSIAL